MRRLLIASLAMLLALPLVAAAAPALFSKPVVVVYPFTANGTLVDREASSRLATMIAQQMATTGKVSVAPPPPGTERKDFLTVARTANADYYVTGYISPLGNGVSLVEQVVSTTTGIVVYSTTTQLDTYADAGGQGDNLASIISQHANRGLAAIGTAPPAPSPTPPSSQEAQANLGKLFGRKKKPVTAAVTTAPAAASIAQAVPVATPTPPVDVYAIVPIEGNADSRIKELATQRLVDRTHGERVVNGAAACAAHNVHNVLNGTLNLRYDATSGGSRATLQLVASDCSGKVVFRNNFTNDAGLAQNAEIATDSVIDAAVQAFLNPAPKHRKR